MTQIEYVNDGSDPTQKELPLDPPGCRIYGLIGAAIIALVFGLFIGHSIPASATPAATKAATIEATHTATPTPTETGTPAPIVITSAPLAHTSGPELYTCTYIVQPGETLGTIGAKYKASASWLAKAAKIPRADHIEAGQKLTFSCYSTPTPTPDNGVHG